MTAPSETAMGCPDCGCTLLWSVEPMTVMYPVTFTSVDGADVPEMDYTGDSAKYLDDSAEYGGDLQCQGCGRSLTEAQLVQVEVTR